MSAVNRARRRRKNGHQNRINAAKAAAELERRTARAVVAALARMQPEACGGIRIVQQIDTSDPDRVSRAVAAALRAAGLSP